MRQICWAIEEIDGSTWIYNPLTEHVYLFKRGCQKNRRFLENDSAWRGNLFWSGGSCWLWGVSHNKLLSQSFFLGGSWHWGAKHSAGHYSGSCCEVMGLNVNTTNSELPALWCVLNHAFGHGDINQPAPLVDYKMRKNRTWLLSLLICIHVFLFCLCFLLWVTTSFI